jgi:signal transduction histidine kinase
VLCVADDGRGMRVDGKRSGFGVSGMQERVAMLGGRFSITSELGRGVRLEACLPLLGRTA